MSFSEEQFDIVDEHDNVTGQASRGACHGNPALVHRAVHVLVFDIQGNLLLQKRSLSKDIQPGKWDTSVGGHLNCGESYLAAAAREMYEELGLKGLSLTYLYSSKIRNQVESENVQTYFTMTDRQVRYNPDEITEVRFWERREINETLGTGVFTPNFEEEWHMFNDFVRSYEADRGEDKKLCPGRSFPVVCRELHAQLPSHEVPA